MKQIQPKRIANPSNCGEEIKSTAPKQEYNKSFLLESMMHSSDTDYIGSESEDDDSYASILLLKIKEPECKIHLDLVGILRMCYQANVKDLDNEKQVITLAQLQQFCTKSSIESIITSTSKGNIDADKIILPFPSVEQQRQLGKLYRSESDGAGENIIKIFKELYPSNSDNGNVGIVILLGDEKVSYGDLDLRDI
ncbi:hypothetical protein REIP_1141 [Rickettsia endosymbiont of Ixodes pacificus]|uniref:hypothetical protein n=1 Tax=Rickettsia endosymbiont of Ixodes pacificus TaxID=1133329 RepID=UPI00062001F0|nr:hypothetical protein [Rickettsia endosymbiont of Ixodes pacificus]KJW03119.1 hypothetical protein REIP_1141 [Rickettsia endosymbiont of Ixodes pacificus]